MLRAERDFQDQKGRLQGRQKHWIIVFFSTRSSVELNFIECYWCRAKWFARENCGYNFEALKATAAEALAPVNNVSIRGFYRLALHAIEAYSADVGYGTEEYKQNVYNSHRQVEDRSKW